MSQSKKPDRKGPDAVPPDLAAQTFEVGSLQLVLFEMSAELEPPVEFSGAEREILGHVLLGRTTSEIARVRGTSQRTIANQLASMYLKMGVNTRQELVARLRGSLARQEE